MLGHGAFRYNAHGDEKQFFFSLNYYKMYILWTDGICHHIYSKTMHVAAAGVVCIIQLDVCSPAGVILLTRHWIDLKFFKLEALY